jgi:pre-mRNA-processing factor 6
LIGYQSDLHVKQRTIEQALSKLPGSEKLWRAAGSLEPSVLRKAVEYIPESEAIWTEGVALASNYDDAKWFIDNGLKALGENPGLLVAWSKACERFDRTGMSATIVDRIIECGHDIDWIPIAEKLESEGFEDTARNLVRGIAFDERFLEAAAAADRHGRFVVASELHRRYSYETLRFSDWLQFCERRGTLEQVLAEVLDACGDKESVVLELCGFMTQARLVDVLEKAVQRNPGSDALTLAFVDALIAIGDLEKCRIVLNAPQSLALCLKAAEISEQFGGDVGFLTKCCNQFPKSPEFPLLLVRHLEDPVSVLKTALKNCPGSGELHVELVKALVKKGLKRQRVRAVLERAMEASQDAIVWLVASEYEPIENRKRILEEAKSKVREDQLGLIWARQLELADTEGRLTLAKEVAGEWKEVMLIVAVCLWQAESVDQARTTFENLLARCNEYGDGWVFWMRFELRFGDVESVVGRMKGVKVRNGFVWERARREVENYMMSDVELCGELAERVDPMLSDFSIFGEYLKLG